MKNIPDIIKTNFNKFSHIRVSKNKFTKYEAHSHEFYELEYICEGSAVYSVNGAEIHVCAGDMIVVSPMDVHSYKTTDNRFVKTVTIHFVFEYLDELKINLFNQTVLRTNNNMVKIIDLMVDEYFSESLYTSEALGNLLSYLIIQVTRRTKNKTSDTMPPSLVSAIGYINTHFREQLTLDTVCEKSGYSRSYFSKLFKKHMNTGFVEYLNDIRLSYAERQLARSDTSVSQACFESGFGSIRHFSRLYKKNTAAPPGGI